MSFCDFKSRQIPLWCYLVLGVVLVCQGVVSLNTDIYLIYVIFNNLVIVALLGGIHIWYFIKNKKATKVVNQFLGLGDILFWILISFYFSPLVFIFFQVATTLVSLFIYGGINLFFSFRHKTIPLAGLQAIFLAFFELVNLIGSSCQYRDDIILKLLI